MINFANFKLLSTNNGHSLAISPEHEEVSHSTLGTSVTLFGITMVAVQRDSSSSPRRRTQLGGYVVVVLLLILVGSMIRSSGGRNETTKQKPQEVYFLSLDPAMEEASSQQQQQLPVCPYQSFSDLTEDERFPKRGSRHMVTPPKGGRLTLVCCDTTRGPWSIVVHERWAPLGAQRFLEMITSRYFTEIPLFRCIKKFLCQFGLSSDASLSSLFQKTIPDDKNWLPEGKEYRSNKEGVKRFAKGYIAYAGGGENSRNRQLIVSLDNVGTLAGGSPWEVPFGELVGKHSFQTLSKIYTGYGDDGPKQGTILNEGMSDQLRGKFPKLDYVKSCRIVDRQVQEEPY